MRLRSAVLSLVTLASLFAVPGAGGAAVSNPIVSNPPAASIHGHPLWDSWFDLSGYGYEEAEYFVEGNTTKLSGGPSVPYKTRIIVTRPSNPSSFNGTVMLDWVNVTAQFENAVDTILAQEMLMREGFAFVHVSAQAAGLCCTPLTPKIWDPVRYGSLNHPGDDYAFDIFSQVAQAVRAPAGIDPMDGLTVQRVIAAGQSQSAGKLYTYVTQAQSNAGVIDGFLIHGGGSKSFPQPLAVPALHLLSDLEAAPAVSGGDPKYRLWEIAGSSHSDFWLDYHQEIGQGPRALADAPKQPSSGYDELNKTAGNYGEQIHPKQFTCIVGGSLFPMHYAASAAIHALDQWVRTGNAPPDGPRFAFSGSQLVRDEYGNAVGGIRLPPVEAPVARYISTVCQLGGITIPFTEAELILLYPTHADYYSDMTDAGDDAVSKGFLLAEDAADLLARADAAKSRWPTPE